jgi:hypothetical protein
MSISLRDAELLLDIINSVDIKKSAFSSFGKKLVELMIEFGALESIKLSRVSFQIIIRDKNTFDAYLQSYLDISDLSSYIEAMSLALPQRSELAALGVNTKVRSTHPKSGFHINSPDMITIQISGREINIDLPGRCALFVHADTEFILPEDILIVGVENFENITNTDRQRALFPQDRQILFIERNNRLKKLLGEIGNDYLHFGDFDLAGIQIYQTEYEPIVQARGSYFIPKSLKEDIKKGPRVLFEKHAKKYKNLVGNTTKTQELIDLIKEEKKTLEQEFYI